MSQPMPDQRSDARKNQDERIAAEPLLAAPALPPNARPMPIESHLGRSQRPIAIAGVVERI